MNLIDIVPPEQEPEEYNEKPIRRRRSKNTPATKNQAGKTQKRRAKNKVARKTRRKQRR